MRLGPRWWLVAKLKSLRSSSSVAPKASNRVTMPTSNTPVSERPVTVDAARLLLIVYHFAVVPDSQAHQLRCWPQREVSRYFTPEYYLQKLDFLVRYPRYLAYELTELHANGVPSAADAETVKAHIRQLLADEEPELRTTPFRRFWRGAYESIDRVEAWWFARGVVFTASERRGGSRPTSARPQKYFFLTPLGESAAERLIQEVAHAEWYDVRIRLIHRYFGRLSASEIKALQYSHQPYREAQLNELIPDLSESEIAANFRRVFRETLELPAHV